MQVPDDLLYTAEHEWIRQIGELTIRVGITDYAQDQLGDVVYVELPTAGAAIAKDDLLAEIESTKSVGEVYAPANGTVTAVNVSVAESPEMVNSGPYEDGWLVEMKLDENLDVTGLLDAGGYRNLTE